MRVRWLRADWPSSVRSLAQKMKLAEFQPDAVDGFLLHRVRDASIEGQYIEKVVYDDDIVDPFGVTQRFQRIDYRKTRFCLYSDFPQIEIWDSPRSVQGFTARLSEITRFAVSIATLSANTVQWIDAFARASSLRVELTAIQAGDVNLAEGVVGKLHLKGSGNVRDVLQQIIGRRSYRIEKAVLRTVAEMKPRSITLGRDATACITGPDGADLAPALRESLSSAVS